MYSEIELCKSLVVKALNVIDSGDDISLLASMCKSKLCDTYELISNESIQLHGGIGVTDELDIGLFLKRSRVQMTIFGDASYHRDRYATLLEY